MGNRELLAIYDELRQFMDHYITGLSKQLYYGDIT